MRTSIRLKDLAFMAGVSVSTASKALKNRRDVSLITKNKIEAKKLANKLINVCSESFPNVYYILAEMAYIDRDYVLSTKYLRKSIELGLEGDNYTNAIKFLPLSNDISEIILDPVEFNPKVLEGISTKYDEYLPIISPDQDFAFFTCLILLSVNGLIGWHIGRTGDTDALLICFLMAVLNLFL
mgnify:CR=1 FL=1